MTKKQIDKKFDSIVAFSELERFIDQKLKNYSSGMSVRLAFSVSIHANREILLMDEVLAVGDTNFQKKCMDTFRDYRKRNKTVVLVTHDIGAVRNYCSRAFLLHNGKIEKMGDVDEVCDAYIMKNMSADVKKELQGKEDVKKSEAERENELKASLKNKKQSIVDIKVFDANKKELIIVTREDNFFVDVLVDIKELCDDLHLAVQIWDKSNNYFVSGNNTQNDIFDCDWRKGKNKIRMIFENNNLNDGEIYIKVILFQYKESGNIILDELSSMDKNASFNVRRRDSGGGIMYIKHNWERVDEK
jgi:energy-coupling factor transporter ATP-binding protein EcfA2